MKVKSSKYIGESLVNNVVKPDYADVFYCEAPSGWNSSPDDVMVDFWTVMPGWVNALFGLRNILVKPFGLKGGNLDTQVFERDIRQGNDGRFVSVAGKNPSETVIKLADSHLDAYLSVLFGEGRIYAITAVKYHNRLGRAYFFFIRPFHKLVVRSMLKGSVRRLSSENK